MGKGRGKIADITGYGICDDEIYAQRTEITEAE
jgi:hypothetical protein